MKALGANRETKKGIVPRQRARNGSAEDAGKRFSNRGWSSWAWLSISFRSLISVLLLSPSSNAFFDDIGQVIARACKTAIRTMMLPVKIDRLYANVHANVQSTCSSLDGNSNGTETEPTFRAIRITLFLAHPVTSSFRVVGALIFRPTSSGVIIHYNMGLNWLNFPNTLISFRLNFYLQSIQCQNDHILKPAC